MDVPILPKTNVKLWAKEATIIPSNYVGFISTYSHLPQATNLFIENRRNKFGALIPNCVVNNTSGEFSIPVMNITKHDIKFQKNEKITSGKICVEQKNIEGVLSDKTSERLSTKLVYTTTTNEKSFDFNQIQIGEQVSKEGIEKLKRIVDENISCFSYNLSDLGTTRDVEFKIELLSNEPITFRPYRLSHVEREYIRKEIETMKRAGIICDSESNYSSPILLVNKKNGEKRICIDYRVLNKITKKKKCNTHCH